MQGVSISPRPKLRVFRGDHNEMMDRVEQENMIEHFYRFGLNIGHYFSP